MGIGIGEEGMEGEGEGVPIAGLEITILEGCENG